MNLLTRSDFDGLACGVLLKAMGIIDTWKFVHPKDLQDGIVEVTGNDVLANVPYVEGCALWFDHHISENLRLGEFEFKGAVEYIDSAARVIYNYYKGEHDLSKFGEMLDAVDKVDAAHLSIDEIKNPEGWVLLGYIMDPRTGIGRFRDFRVSNYQLMEMLMDFCSYMTIDEILAHPDVKERVEVYKQQAPQFEKMLREHTCVDGNVIITDLRGQEVIYSGNRFMIYALFPEQNISVWVVDGKQKLNAAIAVGYSVINRTSKVNVGQILLEYGGGGHHQVGTCQVPYEDCDKVLEELAKKLQ